MRSEMKNARCMAYREGGLFIAVCLDMSLAAQANTRQAAINKLNEQIRDFLAEAFSDAEYTYQLLSCKAPLSLWCKYYLVRLASKFNRHFQSWSALVWIQ